MFADQSFGTVVGFSAGSGNALAFFAEFSGTALGVGTAGLASVLFADKAIFAVGCSVAIGFGAGSSDAELAFGAFFVYGAGFAAVSAADFSVFAIGIGAAFSFSAGSVEAELSFLALGIRTAFGAGVIFAN